jgi:hypothetical protein
MAAIVDVDVIVAIHALLRQQADLTRQMQRGPQRVALATKARTQLEQNVDSARQQLRRMRMEADDKQLQLRQREAKVANLKLKRNECQSNKEYQLLTEHIAAEEQANAVLSDETLELLVKIDDQQAALKKAQDDLANAEKELSRVADDVQTRGRCLADELRQVESRLLELEARLPGELLSEYRRLVSLLGEEALAEVDEKTCGHCHQQLTSQTLADLRFSRGLFCGNCGSLMYLPKNELARR